MADRICSVEGCAAKHMARGFCRKHYCEARSAGLIPAASYCTICGEPTRAKGLCDMHYLRNRRTGDPATHRGNLRAEGSNRWRGSDIGYAAMHTRLRVQRGLASDQVCVDCGSPASDWSLRRIPDPRLDDRTGLSYSTDLMDYEPRCKPCHGAYDAGLPVPVGVS